MATRLYPSTDKQENIEAMAGVQFGTYARLADVKASHKGSSDDLFDVIDRDIELAKLDNFLTFGWGKLASNVERFGLDCVADSTKDRAQIVTILFEHFTAKGINPITIPSLALLSEGLVWS